MKDRLERKSVLKRTMKALTGTVEALSKLERDPPIVELAEVERSGGYDLPGLRGAGNDVLRLASMVNDLRRRQWELETYIKQAFLSKMRASGYLPSDSREIGSLKGSLPNALITGDDRVWKYSYDRYIPVISAMVGRDHESAPTSKEVWASLERKCARRLDELVSRANLLIPQLLTMRARCRTLLVRPDKEWEGIKVKRPIVKKVKRPIRPIIIIKRPVPLEKRPKRPRKKLFGGPERRVVGPEGFSK